MNPPGAPPGARARSLALEHFRLEQGQLAVDAHRVVDLAERFGTPSYVYSGRVLRARHAAIAAALGDKVRILFALKANPSLAVARQLRQLGAGAEVASEGELCVAQAAGFPGEAIQFAGPGKRAEELERAVMLGATLNVESASELKALVEVVQSLGRPARVALRVNPKTAAGRSRMNMGGGSAKFGIDEETIPELARWVEASPGLMLRGLHQYGGTQTFDAEAWLAQAAGLLDTVHAVEAAIERRLDTVDFGGGFGVATFDSDPHFDLNRVGQGLAELVRGEPCERSYFVELGRALCAEAGLFVTRVLHLKESRGKRFAILDGGMNHHAAAAGIGSVLRRSYPVLKATAVQAEPGEAVHLAGPLCTPADCFPEVKSLPPLRQDDVLVFLASGAYGLSFSNLLFLGHPTPAEVWVDGAQAMVVRDRSEPADLLRGQTLPGEG